MGKGEMNEERVLDRPGPMTSTRATDEVASTAGLARRLA